MNLGIELDLYLFDLVMGFMYFSLLCVLVLFLLGNRCENRGSSHILSVHFVVSLCCIIKRENRCKYNTPFQSGLGPTWPQNSWAFLFNLQPAGVEKSFLPHGYSD